MKAIKKKFYFEQAGIIQQLFRWTILTLPVAVCIGLTVAFFLWLPELVTRFRWQHESLLFLIPFAGIFIQWLYSRFGKNADAGNNLVMEEIHKPGGGVPIRMTPLILFTTVITHLFGGSAGREGTAIQMGGSISAWFAKLFGLRHLEKRMLLMCGMSAGFGAVFGTPVAATIFALEVLTVGRIKYDALLPCFIAAVTAHITCISAGIVHTRYPLQVYNEGMVFFYRIKYKVIPQGR